MKYAKWIVLAIVAITVGWAWFQFDLGQYLTLATLKDRQAELDAYYQANTALTIGLFFIMYVAVTALSLPGAAIMTLAAGAIFGLVVGTILVSFASTIGATLAFLIARFLIGNWVQERYGERLKKMNDGVEREGGYYLFALRLVPAFPFFVINLAMALTPIKTWTFYWVSQVGMLAGTIVYVNAGTQLAQVDAAGDLLSPVLIGSFILLGMFPLIAKKSLQLIKGKKDVPQPPEEV